MVQRKICSKLGVQADHVKAERQHTNLKPASQNQDCKNRGTDLKKKSSRSFKLSPFESLTESPTRKNNTSQPVTATGAAHSRQQCPIRADGSPNYMKSTICFDAKKEKIQVRPTNTQTSSDGKSRSRRNSGSSSIGSVSSHKPAKSLTRSPSLKLAGALTKTPTFKPASVKKASRVALCADMKAQKATCSSTLKDSKFPAFLTLSPGGTESEGTPIMKACPYTYCSLKGHIHSPLPSLKCFLSATRRLLKTQKSIKLDALSPIGVKPCGDYDQISFVEYAYENLDFYDVDYDKTNDGYGRTETKDIVDERLAADAQDDLSDGECKNTNMRENNHSVEEKGETKTDVINSEDRIDSGIEETESDENRAPQVSIMEVEVTNKSVKKAEDNSQAPDFSNQEQSHPFRIRCKRLIEDSEGQREFNPRDPNYLPLIPDPDKEKVDLRHQIIDDRKNSEEWMLDFALQQTVTKLGPAGKKKVALLVEAFETVMPISKCETNLMNASKAFTQAKPIKACF